MTATEPGQNLSYAEVVNDPKLKLTPFERQCGLLWPTMDPALNTKGRELALARVMLPEEFADAADVKPAARREFEFQARRRVRWAVTRVAERVNERYTELREAAAEFRRETLGAVRNSRCSGRTPETFVGVKPYGRLDNEKLAELRTREEYLADCADLDNYREISLRSPMVGGSDLPPIPMAEKLLHLSRYCSAQAELGAPVR